MLSENRCGFCLSGGEKYIRLEQCWGNPKLKLAVLFFPCCCSEAALHQHGSVSVPGGWGMLNVPLAVGLREGPGSGGLFAFAPSRGHPPSFLPFGRGLWARRCEPAPT